MNLKDSDVNHLRRLLGFVRCEIGQSPDDMVATVQSILPAIGEPNDEGKGRLVRSYLESAAVPKYVRAAIKALEKALVERCSACATPIKIAGGIGPYCPNKKCEVTDNLLGYSPTTGES